ncbi:MAG: arginine--tRNA ligase [archaeon]|nr:arginine--tRNA ligase [archaeon]
MDFREELVKDLKKATKLSHEEVSTLLTNPPNSAMGDYAFPCFKLGGNPKEAAEKLKKKLSLSPFIEKTEVAGPYLNLFLDQKVLTKEVLSSIRKQKNKYGKGNSKKNIVVEYCGPNTNKPLHLGHVRNMALGNSVCRILSFAGNKIHPVNIINDRGIHICQSMTAYKKWAKEKKPDKKGDHFVGDYYVQFAKKLKEDPSLKDEAQELLFKWEMKDPEVRALWKKMNAWVLKGFAETYKRFGISFEKEYFESELYEQGKEVVFEGLKKKIFVKDDNKSIIAELEKFGLPNKVLLRGDGTSVYITQDMYLAEERYKDFSFDKMIYVVASEQKTHFQQLFKILELLKRPFARNLFHLSYGLVNLPTGRMKSREGTVVDADDIMDETSDLAVKEVNARYPEISTKEKKERAEFIALGALKFFMLKNDAVRDMVYNSEESLNFEGETGPYIQYTHARASSILRKEKLAGTVHYDLLQEPQEKQVVVLLEKFSSVISQAAETYKPSLVCHYLIELSQAFNEFYHSCKVISEDTRLQNARLALVDATRQVLANGLDVLGIHAPERM